MILDFGLLMDQLVVNHVTTATNVLPAQQLLRPVMHNVPLGHGVMALTCIYVQRAPMGILLVLLANRMAAIHVQLVTRVQWMV